MGQFKQAYQDAVKAKELNSEWPKVCIQQIMRHSSQDMHQQICRHLIEINCLQFTSLFHINLTQFCLCSLLNLLKTGFGLDLKFI